MFNTQQERNDYYATHMWMKYHFGTPQKCENCKATKKRMYHWANISGTYVRERSDWLRLCVPCHKAHDIKALGGKIKAKALKVQPSKICPECYITFFKNPHLSKKQWESTAYCGRKCSTAVTGRKMLGTKQSAETRALKTRRLKERWQKQEWRDHISAKMIGNQYAKKKS